MHDDTRLTPAERELESALAQLRPAGHAIDRDQLMFTAGIRATRRSYRRWQASTGVMTVLLAASWLVRLPTPGPEQVAAVPTPDVHGVMSPAMPAMPLVPEKMVSASSENWLPVPGYVHLRNRVMVEGADALPSTRIVASATTDGPPAAYLRAFGPYRNTGG